MAKNAVALVDEPQLPAGVYDYGDDAGAGFENITSQDSLMPMLDILDFKSAEVIDGEGSFKPGDMIIRTLGETFNGKKGVILVPSYVQVKFVQWRPKDQGGGVVAQYDPSDDFVRQVKEACNWEGFGKMKVNGRLDDKTADDLVETKYVYGVLGVPGAGADNWEIEETRHIVVPFASTRIAAFRSMVAKAKVLVPRPDGRKEPAALFAHSYRLKTTLVDKGGNKWFTYDISFNGANATEARLDPRSAIFDEARSVYQLVKAGLAKVDTSKADRESVDRPARAAADSSEIPF